jgi:hypothetical protein
MKQEFVIYSADRILKLETLYQTILKSREYFREYSGASAECVITLCDLLLQDFKDEPEQG